jgi:hypothetical protein
MEKSGKRGKIPQTDWPLIMARYEAGETLSSIARTYDCSPPAISYIVSRSKAKPTGEVSEQAAPEPHLIKAPADGAMPTVSAGVEPTLPLPAPAAMIRREPVNEPRPAVAPNGVGTNGDQRRTLHLGLGGNDRNGNGHAGNGHAPATANVGANSGGNGGQEAARANGAVPRAPQAAAERTAPRPFQPPPRNPAPFDTGRNGRDLFAMPENRAMAQQPREAEPGRKDNGSFIDQELRSRVDGDIAAFLAAFDAALAADTQESRFGLREATDRLLRAGARTRIELERLEARVPLSPREGGVAAAPGAWRHR